MTIPLIQGTLRYAFKVHSGEENTAKAKAEGAVFAASVLPLVHNCSTEAAGTIYDNMKLGATSTDFVAVKNAFESTYSCLSISCAEVGGYWDALDNKYEAFAGPCTDVTATVTVTITVDIAALDTAGQNALIAEFARTASNGIMTADVTLSVVSSTRRRRLASSTLTFTVNCGAKCTAVSANLPKANDVNAAEALVTSAANVAPSLSNVGVLTVEPQVIPSPPPPSPPFTDCGSLSPSPPPPPAPPVSTCSESKTDNAVILGMGVPLALVALASLGFSCLLVSKEKTGKPLFLSLANGHTNGHNGAPNSKV